MTVIYEILGYPLGWVMWICYIITHNYVLSLLIFTVITRLIMIPMTLGQQKTTAKMAMLKPQMEELQRRYAKDKQRLNEEMMKLYNKEGYNPMSGCLPLLIQFPILFGLIDVIYRPLTHILRLPADIVAAGKGIAVAGGTIVSRSGLDTSQLAIIRGVNANPSAYASLGPDIVSTIQSLNLNFLGMDLSQIPSFDMVKNIFSQGFNLLLLIPILSGLSALVMSLITMKNASGTMENAAAGSMKGMMLTMPIFSTMIAFSVPAGVGLYWFYSNVVGTVQAVVMNKIYNPKEMAEKAKQDYEARQEAERQERIEAKRLAREGKLENQEKAMSQKELNRRRLAEARRRDAEKYGEVYVEVTDEDLR